MSDLSILARTAFKHSPTLPECAKHGRVSSTDRTCPMCKAKDCPPVNDEVVLNKYREFYKVRQFKVYACDVCNYEYSVYK